VIVLLFMVNQNVDTRTRKGCRTKKRVHEEACGCSRKQEGARGRRGYRRKKRVQEEAGGSKRVQQEEEGAGG
jgi:hypothetical protein